VVVLGPIFTLTSPAYFFSYVIRLSASNGAVVDAVASNSTGSDGVSGLAVDTTGSPIVVGFTSGTSTFMLYI